MERRRSVGQREAIKGMKPERFEGTTLPARKRWITGCTAALLITGVRGEATVSKGGSTVVIHVYWS